jgi:nitroreductase
MNETLQVIMDRRSIRQYKTEQIADEELQQILEAALYAPNARNQQKWHFTVIQDKGLLAMMVSIIRDNVLSSGIDFFIERAGGPDYNTFYGAPTAIMITGNDEAPLVKIDCAAAAQNIALAAESLGIGSCIMASPGFLFASEKGNELRGELGIPRGYGHICTVALGYMDGEKPPAPPRDRDVINYVR